MDAVKDLRKLLEKYSASGTDSAKLWQLLSAIRGPDTVDYTLKHETTKAYRAALCRDFFFPTDKKYGHSAPALREPFSNESKDQYAVYLRGLASYSSRKAQRHFVDHFVDACIQLKFPEGPKVTAVTSE